MARPSMIANLTEEEIIELQTAVRSTKVESRIKQRSHIILDWHEGKSYDETQALRRVSRRVVAKWRSRFMKQRMRGLVDAARSGKPVVITEAQKNKVIHLACSKPSKGYSNWSQQRIGEEVGISQSKVNKILQEHDLKSH
ncbi:MAG TPA: helix-turn-helix domain-containing protein [Saprospiraceae bacterium]|nr:helix-turn-helix domain containing protein [Saprospiraceae bacterium]HRO09854.1 helix-turn-helix domain-containing protein [Saprospiraceae bacterium]HRP43098.1 helix-turn-helix domain-containing protein [Saprospiraceae bacterium]